MDRDTADEIKRHFNVVAEGLRSEIRTVAEGVGANTDKLDRIEERLDRVDERLDRVDGRLDRVDGRLDRVEARLVEEFSELKAMIRLSFGELDRRMRSLESDVTSLLARLEKLEARAGN